MKWTIVLLFLAFAGCKGCKTKPNTSDTTPPVIDWTVQNKTQNTEQKFTGNGVYNAKYGDVLVVIPCADDDGGIKQLEYYTNSSYTCLDGDITQNTGPGLISPTILPLGLDADGNAWKRYCAILNMSLNFGCASGFHFSSGGAVASLKATTRPAR